MTTTDPYTRMFNTSNSTTAPGNINIVPQIFVDQLNDANALILIIPIIFVAILMAIGVIGNPIVIYIYGCRFQQTTTRVFVTTLAALDFVNCVVTMPTELLVLRYFYYLDVPYLCRLSRGFTFWMNNASGIVLLIIAIDRFIKINLPDHSSFTYKSAKKACALAVLIAFGASWPAFVIYGREYVDYPSKDGIMKMVLCGRDTSIHSKYTTAYYIFLTVAFTCISLLIAFLYSRLCVQVWRRKIRKDKRSESLTQTSFKFSADGGKMIYKGSVGGQSDNGMRSPSTSCSDDNDVFKNDNSDTRSPQPRNRRPTLTLKLSRQGRQAGKATMMLGLATLVYIVAGLPFFIIVLIRTVEGQLWYPSLSDPEKVLINLFLRSYLISNAVNPIIYGVCNVQFRHEASTLSRRLTGRR